MEDEILAHYYGGAAARSRAFSAFNRSETPNATAVLDKYWDGQLPVSPSRIAASIGIKVQAGTSTMNISGVIEMTNDGAVITYNPDDVSVRRRFTIAHEVGHYVLGHLEGATKRFRDPASNFSSGSASPEEREANQFAAGLLMPKTTLKYAIENEGITSVTALADLFGVSQVAMSYRLTNLGLASV